MKANNGQFGSASMNVKSSVLSLMATVVLAYMALATTSDAEPVNEITVLRARVKMLEAKVRTQAAEILRLRGGKPKQPTTKPKLVKLDVRRVLAYAVTRKNGLDHEKISIRRTQIVSDAHTAISKMIKGKTITLTYPILDIRWSEGNALLAVDYPIETGFKKGYPQRTFSVPMTRQRAVKLDVGDRLTLRCQVSVVESERCIVGTQYCEVDPRGGRRIVAGSVVVLCGSAVRGKVGSVLPGLLVSGGVFSVGVR